MKNVVNIGIETQKLSLQEACIAALKANNNNLSSLLELVDNPGSRLIGIIQVCIDGNNRLVEDLKSAKVKIKGD